MKKSNSYGIKEQNAGYQRLETGGKGKSLMDRQEVSIKWDEQTLGFAVQQSTVMDYNHLMSLTGYVACSDTNELNYETQKQT